MGSNIKSSTSGNDSLTSSSNNELFDGGEGSDTVIFNGKFSNYSFTRTSTSLELGVEVMTARAIQAPAKNTFLSTTSTRITQEVVSLATPTA